MGAAGVEQDGYYSARQCDDSELQMGVLLRQSEYYRCEFVWAQKSASWFDLVESLDPCTQLARVAVYDI